MTESLEARVEALPGHLAIRILEHASQRLFEGLETPHEEMIQAALPKLQGSGLVEQVQGMSAEQRAQPLPEEASAEIARGLLLCYARDPDLAPLVEASLQDYRDDKLMAGTILATGVAISMIIVAATTRLKARIGTLEIEKQTADAELVGEIVKNFSAAASG